MILLIKQQIRSKQFTQDIIDTLAQDETIKGTYFGNDYIAKSIR